MSLQDDLRNLDYSPQRSLCCSLNSIEENNAALEQPQKIGHYSINVHKDTAQRVMMFDETNLTYLDLPKELRFHLDLTDGYDKNINWLNVTTNKLDDFLRWILRNRLLIGGQNPNKPLEFDFITYRGTFTKIMTTPFLQNEKWFIGASKFNGTIYLCLYPDDNSSADKNNDFDRNNLFCFGGYRFERYITRSSNDKLEEAEKTDHKILNEYCAIIKSRLKSVGNERLSLLYAAEMDCLDSDQTDSSNLKSFVEIKTTKTIFNENHQRNFSRFKLIKWWAQSYLVGIEKLICGYKDQHVVNGIQTFHVHDIPHRCQQFWTKRQCLNYLYQFLSYVKMILKDEQDPYRVYLFTNETKYEIKCRQLIDGGNLTILPKWYVSEIIGQKPSNQE